MNLDFDIHILGNGSAAPHKTRNPSAQFINVEGNYWLIDCGEGTQFRMLRQGLKRSKLNGIMISHMHGDHYLGIFGLLSSLSMDQRTKELYVIGPSALEQLMKLHLNQGGYELNYPIIFKSTDEVKMKEVVYEEGELKIEAFPLQHRIPCCGYRLTYHKVAHQLDVKLLEKMNIPKTAWKQISNGNDYIHPVSGDNLLNSELAERKELWKSYGYCSDTAYFDELVPYVQGVDLLYHEATFLEAKSIRASETYHSTATQAATIALKANCKELIIGHFSSRYDELDEFIDEARIVFEHTQIANEGDLFSL